MSIQRCLKDNKNIQDNLLAFLNNESNTEERYKALNDIINEHKICNNKYVLSFFLHLLLKISKNNHRQPNFITKIEQILGILENDIKKYFTNSEIFNIFKGNKRILLFLFNQKIIIIDKYIVKNIISKNFVEAKYPHYFSPEIKPFINEEWFPKYEESHSKYCPSKNEWVLEIEKELPEDFYELRKEGENDSYICKLIRNDSIKEFIQYINKNNYPLQSIIEQSIYETNSFLIKKHNGLNYETNWLKESKIRYSPFYYHPNYANDVTLIKYAAFFGSFQIFKYLQLNGADITPELILFAIHSENAEIIQFLEENCIEKIDENERKNLYDTCLIESIKCHHIEITNYLLDNFFSNDQETSERILIQSLKSYNFSFISNEQINEDSFFYLCQYDYCSLLSMLLNTTKIDINQILIK